jgi:tricorn protease
MFVACPLFAAGQEARLMRYPDISRDAVVFSYAGDLWTAARAGGQARRLTSHPGDEVFAKFSPDGKWIAFTGEYDGNADVYVMPAGGGEPRRLTYHPANDLVLGWTPDSKKILFRSDRASSLPRVTRLFLVPVEGGLPEMLPLPRASLSSFSSDGDRIAFNPTSQDFRTWKRYRGGWLNYIGIYDLKRNAYEEVPRSGAMDMFPMWKGDSIYFVSDRTGVMNLYRYGLKSKQTQKLTDYSEYDVKWPSLGPDAVVYENGGRLYRYDLEGGKPVEIPIQIASDLLAARPEIKSVEKSIRTFNLSPSGVRALFEARGEILTLPAEHGPVRNLTDTPGIHELNPAWSPDGKWIAYLSDRTGEYEIYLRPQKGGDEVRITTDADCYRFGPVWAPDSKKLAYWDKKGRLWYVDTDAKKPVEVDKTDYPGGEGDFQPDWSGDSRWLGYVKPGENHAGAIYLYSLEQKRAQRVTDGFYDDSNPVFDPGGKYLFFLSQRFFLPTANRLDNRFSYFNTNGLFALVLKAGEASPFPPRDDEEGQKAKDKEAEKEKDKDKDKAAKPADDKDKKAGEEKTAEKKDVEPVEITLDGLASRLAAVPVPPGIYQALNARKGKLFYASTAIEPAGDAPSALTVHLFDMEKREDKVVLAGVTGYALDKEGAKLLYQAKEVYGIVDAAPDKKVGDGKLNTAAMQVRVDPREEWKQIFHEAWRIERDFYWDPGMGGLDWNKIGARYESLLPNVAHRSDLNYIIGELIAELNTSHTYVGGGDVPDRKHVGVGLLGVDFASDGGFYKFARIYQGENWNDETRSPLTEPGLKVKQGDYLIAVNGIAARAPADPYSFFQDLAGKLVTLKINDKPSEQGAWEISVTPVGSEGALRYHDWVESRRRFVAERTGGRAAYMHVPDTSIAGLKMFDKYFTAQIGKDALIVDERNNSGGMIPDFYTEKLSRQLLSLVSPREGKDVPWPPVAIYGPKVMVVNELAGSGGDCFPLFFQEEKIGPVVGTRTWGGLIGISRQVPLIDGGYVTAPEFAFWSSEKGGQWIVENHGVDPDYLVEQRPDLEIAGHDPQLEKAIELVNKALKDYPALPERPKYPKKNVLVPAAAR